MSFRTGVGVTGLLHDAGAVPHVSGIVLEDGTELRADLTVIAGGRRSTAPEWFEAMGCAPIDEVVEDTGIVYYSRFYRLKPGMSVPPRTGPIGGDLGYLKYGVFAGDNETFSITLAVSTEDDTLRRALDSETTFDLVGRNLVVTAPYLDGRADAITGVHKMAGLLNRWREFAPDGQPIATGVHVVGDAAVCTNPLYGRGCSTGFWHAHLLAEAVAGHPDDPLAQATAFAASTRQFLYPWYVSSVNSDRDARRVAGRILAGDEEDPNDAMAQMRAVLREGLLPALRMDALVLRAFFRNFNLLTPPDALLTDPEVMGRVVTVYGDRENRPPEPVLGPKRAGLLALL